MISFFKKRNRNGRAKNSLEKEEHKICSVCNTLITQNEISPAGHLCNACFIKQHVYSGKCSDSVNWKYENGTLTISGNGIVLTFENSIDETRQNVNDPHNLGFAYDYPAFNETDISKDTETIIAEEGIVSITLNFAFSFHNLKTLILARSVTNVDDCITETLLRNQNENNAVITVRGFKGTYAEIYAQKNGISFLSMDKS